MLFSDLVVKENISMSRGFGKAIQTFFLRKCKFSEKVFLDGYKKNVDAEKEVSYFFENCLT